MKWIHVKAVFESKNISLAEELVSDIFFSLGLQGVVCQVPLKEPEEGFGSDAVPIPDDNAVSGYLPDTDSSQEVLEKIRQKAEELERVSDPTIHISMETESVDQEEWAESWKSFFHVSRITDHIVIKPAWREFTPDPDDIIIEIDPGMAFGTGTHPTTSMCIALIEKYLTASDLFLDVGTGSGILMIAAAKLGATSMSGIDNDEVAVQVARENLEKNSIDPAFYHIEQNTLDQFLNTCSQRFNLVAANILAEVIVDILPEIKQSLQPGGKVILSGIIREKEDIITQSLVERGFSIIEIKTEGEWIAVAATL